MLFLSLVCRYIKCLRNVLRNQYLSEEALWSAFACYSFNIKGRIRSAMMKPPAIKQMVAIKEGSCRLDNPIIEWPEVHPPAYRVPKPTRKPPNTIKNNPFTVTS